MHSARGQLASAIGRTSPGRPQPVSPREESERHCAAVLVPTTGLLQGGAHVRVVGVAGAREARGATVGGSQGRSLRLPRFVVSTEVLFTLPDERLSIRHDAGA